MTVAPINKNQNYKGITCHNKSDGNNCCFRRTLCSSSFIQRLKQRREKRCIKPVQREGWPRVRKGETYEYSISRRLDYRRYALKEPERRWDLNNQIGHSYVYMIAGYLGYTRAKAGLHLINRGVSAESIGDIYTRRKTDIFAENPDIFSLLVGINESLRINDGENITVHMKNFEKIYRLLLEELREQRPDSDIVLCEPFVFETERNTGEYKKQFAVVKEISEMLPGIVRDYNAVYVTLWNEMRSLCTETGNTCWTWDGIHPTEAGHHFIALKWLEKVSLSGLLEKEYGK